jgi:hypothetical protein
MIKQGSVVVVYRSWMATPNPAPSLSKKKNPTPSVAGARSSPRPTSRPSWTSALLLISYMCVESRVSPLTKPHASGVAERALGYCVCAHMQNKNTYYSNQVSGLYCLLAPAGFWSVKANDMIHVYLKWLWKGQIPSTLLHLRASTTSSYFQHVRSPHPRSSVTYKIST